MSDYGVMFSSTQKFVKKMGACYSLDDTTKNEFTLELRDASPSHLLTKIESFSELKKRGISNFESAEFEAGDHKWKLIIYPDGDKVGKKVGHISVYLSIVGTSSLPVGWEVTAIFTFFIYNHKSDNYLCFRGVARHFNDNNPVMRVSKLIAKKTLKKPSNGYVLDDNYVFGAEVFVIKDQLFTENISVFDLQLPYERQWEISDFSKHENGWGSEEFSVGGYNWEIGLYPNGLSRARDRYVSIFLYCIDSKRFPSYKKVKATCLFTLRNRLDEENNHCWRATNWFTCSSQSWGFYEFKAIDDMYDEGFIVEDSCLLKIQLSVEGVDDRYD